MDEHFRAFSFVDRITSIQPGIRARGIYQIPPGLESFSGSLVAEAVGQLAAWLAMSALDFKMRPVAGIAGGIELLSQVRPGQTLELAVELDSVDAEAASYGGTASVDGKPVIRLENCVGPMLPVEEFDDPQALRARFAVLCGDGAAPGGFGEIPPLAFARNGGEPGKSARATLQVPASAPFFADHFPRRPVFPGTLLMHLNLELAAAFVAEIPPPAAGRWNLRGISDVKLRAFIPPGEQLELEAKLAKRAEDSATVIVETRNAKRLLGGARILLSATGGNL